MQILKERDESIDDLEEEIALKDLEKLQLSESLLSAQKQLAGLENAVNERDTVISSQVQSIEDNNEEVQQLKETLNDAENQIQFLLASNSWRFTAPVRFMRRLLVTRPLFFFRKSVSRLSRQMWRVFPIKPEAKNRLKNLIFQSMPTFFGWSKAYKDWAFLLQAEPIDKCEPEEQNLAINNQNNNWEGYRRFPPLASTDVRIIAFYLPQFHPIPENNKWWGEGFTEWTNVKPAQAQFAGHYQPRIPGELGYYDLRETAAQKRQIELAKNYGVNGFCFYFYWFKGKRLLETPIKNYLENRDLDLPFCLCWANENWSRRWDGLDSEMLITQEHSPSDDLQFIEYISVYLQDSRYIRIDGKPLLLVYRPSLLPSPKDTAQRWRKWCRENGIGEIYIAYTQSFEKVDPQNYGFDAAIEFPPNNSAPPDVTKEIIGSESDFGGRIYDWNIFLSRSQDYKRENYKLFRGVNPMWDNTARRKNNGTIFINSSPSGYEKWLTRALDDTYDTFEIPEERMVFINAWNEWAEGAYLEPDSGYGFAYLNATRNAIESTKSFQKKMSPTPSLAVVVHCFYVDVFCQILNSLELIPLTMKLFVTCPEENYESVKTNLENTGFDFSILVAENRGRDIRPFFRIFPQVQNEGFELVLKLHTKKSLHREDGDVWRNDLYEKLLDPLKIEKIISAFSEDGDLGILGPTGHIVSMETYWGSNEKTVLEIARRLGLEKQQVLEQPFVAGSMFFARVSVLEVLYKLGIEDYNFEQEFGQTDGTLAHAIERCFSICLILENKKLMNTDFKLISGVPGLDYQFAAK